MANACTTFLIWQIGCVPTSSSIKAPDSVTVNPEYVTKLVNILYATFPQSIRPVTVEGYQIIDILGGSEICPASFNPQSLVKVDRITHEFTPEQVTLLRTLIENLIVQSSRDVGSLNVFLAKHGLNMGSLLSLLTQEINKVVTPPVVDLLLTTTQPQSLAISYNTGTLQGGLCKVNEQLPIIIFSASLLERVSKSILQNDKLRSLFTGVASFKATYTDPLDPTAVNSSRQITTTSTIFWVILVVLVIILLLVIFYLVRG